jgi:hypothetical protein
VRPAAFRSFVTGFACGAAVTAVTAVTLVMAAPARADESDAYAWASQYGPAVCDTLADHHTIAGLTGILMAVADQGYTAEQSGEYVAESVFLLCPRYVPLLRQFVAIYGGRTA